ncbi:MAG TPA: glycosyltransferase [Terracidiphilus sp.]|nr:glycosyltransferase [Terracidiphilus sp.]
MNILDIICTTDAESGGPIEAVQRISEVLMRDGHHVTVVSLETQEVANRRRYGGPATAVGVGPGLGGYRYNPALDRWLRQHAHEFDVAIVHGVWNYTSLGTWRALRNSGTPYFLFTHGMLDPWFRARYPLKHVAKQIYWWLFEGRILRDARAVLFTCEEEKLRARHVFRGHGYREQVVLYGTAAPGGDPGAQSEAFLSAFPALRGRRYLLFISRIHAKKGCDLLISAFARSVDQLPPDVDLVMAGPDQDGLANGLHAQAQRLGVSHRIHWTGMVSGDVKWGALRSAEAMILPSHQENFGFVVAEAMACSTPVLISDKVNIWREVLASKAGFVEPDTVEGTFNLMLRYFALSREERAAMASSALAGFLNHFDIEASARDLAEAVVRRRGSVVDAPQPVAG